MTWNEVDRLISEQKFEAASEAVTVIRERAREAGDAGERLFRSREGGHPTAHGLAPGEDRTITCGLDYGYACRKGDTDV